MYNTLEGLIRVRELIKSNKTSISEKKDLIFLVESYVQNVNCSNCTEEKTEALSIGMLRRYCQLTSHTTRSFSQVNDNEFVVQQDCPIKKFKL